MKLKNLTILALTALTYLPLPAFTEGFTDNCVIKTGATYAKSYEDLLAKEGVDTFKTCQVISSSPQFGTIAGIKASSSNRMHDSNYQKICNQATTTSKVYCEYVYRSQWQATCCAKLSL